MPEVDIAKKLAEMRARLKKEVGELMDEAGDVLSEVRRDFAELAPLMERKIWGPGSRS